MFGTVTTTLAHTRVDQHALGRVRELQLARGRVGALAPAAFFRGTGLLIHKHCGAFDVTQQFLHGVHVPAVKHFNALGLWVVRHIAQVWRGVVTDNYNFGNAFGSQLAG